MWNKQYSYTIFKFETNNKLFSSEQFEWYTAVYAKQQCNTNLILHIITVLEYYIQKILYT